ncbi:unnamed protein product [Phyllotreta striolata]|uniref:Syntaxin-18 n=1 Tax=Phyllotreta striolata TaxID=444603 RepID=A0A9N9TN63_PHYSR|nr:unnamed protein product [Phyllotreta striolata]
MDITTLFKACVKTVRTTNKSLGNTEQKSNILKVSKDANLSTAKDVVKQITKLRNFLTENKAAYLNVLNYLSTNKTMSELDRQQVDTMAEEVINECRKLINSFKKETNAITKTPQREEHYQNITATLENYLENVSKIYTEAKAVRVKRVIDTHKLSKLETNPANRKPDLHGNDPPNKDPEPRPSVDYDPQLSSEEMQMFEAENEMLYNELNSISDEVRQMEGKVVHIAELQELFTEKVLQQQIDIERIATNVVGSTENVKEANEQIRQAIQRNAGLRVYVLFFLLVMSFSLLFLDWYND